MLEYNGYKLYQGSVHDGDEYRRAYLRSVEKFIEKKLQESYQKRAEFISPDALFENPEKYRRALSDMIGIPYEEYKNTVPTCEKTYVGEDDLSHIYRLKLEVAEEFYFYGILMLPKQKKRDKMPFVIAQHGGSSNPEICSDMEGESNYSFFTKRALERGMVVFVPQLLLWDFKMDVGEKKVKIDIPYERGKIDSRLRQLGLSITGLEIFCLRRSLDYFVAQEYVDEEKIGMMGASYGGYYTLYTSAVDTRIKSIYAVAFFNDRAKYSFGDWRYQGMLLHFSDAEAAGLCAPRKLRLDCGTQDQVFDFSYAPAEAERARAYYRKYQKEENFSFCLWDGGHRFERSGSGFDFFFSGLE